MAEPLSPVAEQDQIVRDGLNRARWIRAALVEGPWPRVSKVTEYFREAAHKAQPGKRMWGQE